MSKTLLKKVICAFLSVVMLVTVLQPFSAFAEGEEDTSESTSESTTEPTTKPTTTKPVKKTATKVTGIQYKFVSKKSEKISMTIKISPARPRRTVRLQLYNSKKKKYVDVKTYTTPYMRTAPLTITIPTKYRNKTVGYWRIAVDESDKAKAYHSKHIKVTTRNIETLELSSKAACIYCLDTNQVLYDKKKDKRLKPASCTKIMTLICVIESGKWSGTSPVTVSAQNVDACKLNPRSGDRYRNKDLCYAMILASSNDSALMLAHGTAGTYKAFTKRMNKTAKKIGLKNTHFTNSFGTPDKKHYTSAYDLCKMSAYGYNYEKYRKVVGTKGYGFKSLKYKKKYGCHTADKFIKQDMEGQIGGKTGFSEVLGASYSGLYEYKGKVYAITIMHAKTKKIRWKDLRKLYKYIRMYGDKQY